MSGESVESTISTVTVYRSGATVTRTGELAESVGETIRFDGLPLSLDDSSVRCKVFGEGLVATDFRVVLDTAASAEELRQTEDQVELRDARLLHSQLATRCRYLHEELALKVAISERRVVEGEEPVPSPLQARLTLVDFLEERQRGLFIEQSAAEIDLEKARLRLEELEYEQQRASTDRHKRINELRKSVIIHVKALGELRDVKIQIQYFVPGAAWAPGYAVRLGSDLETGGLSMRAMVSQHSGEDWQGVTLTLSTADVQQWSELPDLKSRRIGRRQESLPGRGWREPPSGAEELYRDFDLSYAGPVTPPDAMPEGAGGRPKDEIQPVMVAESYLAPPGAPPRRREDFEDEDTGVHGDEIDTVVSFGAEVAGAIGASASMESLADEPTGVRQRPKKQASKSQIVTEVQREYTEVTSEVLAEPDTKRLRDSSLELGIQVAEGHLDYARLRLLPARSHDRGALVVTGLVESYHEYLRVERGVAEQNLEMALSNCLSEAEDIASLPTGHSHPWAEDYDYAYCAQSTIDVQSDGQFHSLPIQCMDAVCKPTHVVVPRESSDVFRTVRLTNPYAAPLLPGPIDVYWSDNFLLTSHVDFTPPHGHVELGLGVDQAVKVIRNTQYREDTVGLMGGSRELAHKIMIEAVNNGAHDLMLEVRERIPIAAPDEDDIKVTVKSVSPPWSPYEQEPDEATHAELHGGHHWKIKLSPGQQVELVAAYEVKMPSKYELQGGNRRER